MQERTVIDKKIRLKPKTANDYQNRGDKECCCAFVVFADDANFEERNDVTTVWYRKTNLSDTIQFQLFKNGVFAQNISILEKYSTSKT